MKILVVDDSEFIRDSLRNILKANGFTVIEAEDGRKGYQKVLDNPDIDLCIVDYNMPGATGLDFADLVRSRDAFANLPIVILSAQGISPYREKAKALKISAWMLKPVDDASLPKIIQTIIDKGVK